MTPKLPPSLRELIGRAAAGRGMSRAERADVARELTAHFREGLEAGIPPERLAEAFGDAAAAARLIARARRRTRPAALRLMHVTLKSAAVAAVLAYVSSAARLHWGEPPLAPVAERAVFAEILAPDTETPRTLEGARRAFDDLFDRLYTPGGGRLTAAGLRMLQAMKGKRDPGFRALVLEPVYFAIPATRSEAEREVAELLAAVEREIDVNGAAAAARSLEASWRQRARSTVWQLRFYPVAAMTPEVVEWLAGR